MIKVVQNDVNVDIRRLRSDIRYINYKKALRLEIV